MKPLSSYLITADFAWHEKRNGVGNRVNGIDFGTPTGTEIAPIESGVCVFAGYDWNSINPKDGSPAKYVIIRESPSIDWLYVHFSDWTAKVGQYYRKDIDLIGYAGATGNVTGAHTHVTKRVNGEAVDFKSQLSNNGSNSNDEPEMTPLLKRMLSKVSDAQKHEYLFLRVDDPKESLTEIAARAGYPVYESEAVRTGIFSKLVTLNEARDHVELNNALGEARALNISVPVRMWEAGTPSPQTVIEGLKTDLNAKNAKVNELTEKIKELQSEVDIDEIKYQVYVQKGNKINFWNFDSFNLADETYFNEYNKLRDENISGVVTLKSKNITEDEIDWKPEKVASYTAKVVATGKSWFEKLLDLIFKRT